MTNKELSSEIRAKIKAKGIKRNTYSISVRDVGYSTSIHIEVKDIKINPKVFEKIVKQYEHIRRDEYTYDILAGCNTFTHVCFDSEMLRKETEKFLTTAKEIWETCETNYMPVIAKKGNSELLIAKNDHTIVAMSERKNLGRHCAYNEYDVARAMAIFNGIGTLDY